MDPLLVSESESGDGAVHGGLDVQAVQLAGVPRALCLGEAVLLEGELLVEVVDANLQTSS